MITGGNLLLLTDGVNNLTTKYMELTEQQIKMVRAFRNKGYSNEAIAKVIESQTAVAPESTTPGQTSSELNYSPAPQAQLDAAVSYMPGQMTLPSEATPALSTSMKTPIESSSESGTDPNMIERGIEGFKEGIGKSEDAMNRRVALRIDEGREIDQMPKDSFQEKTDVMFEKLANLGREVGTGTRMVTAPFTSAFGEMLAPIIEPIVKGTGTRYFNVVEAIHGKDVSDATKEIAKEKIANVVEAYNQASPEEKEVIDNTLNFADVATWFLGGRAVKAVGKEVVEETVEAGIKTAAKGVDLADAAKPIIKEGMQGIETGVKEGVEGFNKGMGIGTKTGERLASGIDQLQTKAADITGEAALKAKDDIAGVMIKSPEKIAKDLDTMIDTSIEKAIRPTVRGKKTIEAVDLYKDNARNAVKNIIERKDGLKLTNEVGEEILLPDSLRSFSESIKQTKKNVFKQYDEIAKTAGETGVLLDTAKLADDLAEIKTKPKWAVIEDNYPAVVKYVDSKIKILEKRGAYTLEQGQEAIKAYNNSLEAYYRNPTPEGYGKVTVDAMIVNNMRKDLDNIIGEATGAEYQVLKKQYGALRAIEEDVAKRYIVNARKNQKGLIDFTDIFSAGDIIAGISSGSPALVAKGAAQNFIKSWYKRINDPDNIIKKMFQEADNVLGKNKEKGDFSKGGTPSTSKLKVTLPEEAALGIKRDVKLSDVDLVIQDASLKKYLANKNQLIKEYTGRFGKKINTDDARNLFKDVGYNGTNSAAVHEASSRLAKDLWEAGLKGKEPKARIMGGGSGAGKSTVVRGMGDSIDDVVAVYDGNLSKIDSAKKLIKQAKDAGKKVEILYVYREPIDAFEDGVLKRMMNSSNADEVGRVVPIDIHVKNHKGALDVARKLYDEGLDVTLMDNSLGYNKAKVFDKIKFDNLKMPDNLEGTLRKITQRYFDNGKITLEQFTALTR